MSQNVLMLLNAPYPADIRVKKETSALIAAGFEIWLLCLRKENEKYSDLCEGIHVERIDAGKNNYQLAFWDVLMSIKFVHPLFRKHIKRIVQREKISVVHVHDLPLAGTALSLRDKLGISVILDMHENYPEALKTWFKWKKNPIARLKNFLFMNPKRWLGFERIACQNADHIIAVVDEMKSRVISEHQINPQKITVVTNTEDKSFVHQPLDNKVYGDLQGRFLITYSGGIGPHRGVDIAIKAMRWLKANPDFQLIIVGSGSAPVMESLKKTIDELKLNNVHFMGYQPFSKFYSYMTLASVNIIPHQSNGHTDNTVPHKLFQGMMAGKPLLVSSSAPLKRLVEKYQSGLVFKAGDDNDLADKLEYLYSHKQVAYLLGENGKKATLDGQVNWEEDQKNLIHLYENIQPQIFSIK